MYAKYVYLFNNHVWFYQPILGKNTHQKMRMSNPSQGESRGVAIDPFFKRCDLQGEGPKG